MLGGAALVLTTIVVARKQIVALASNISDHASFVSEMWTAVNNAIPNAPLQTKLYIVAMAAYETGWGTQTGFKTTNNAFNITAGPAWTGPTTGGADTECDANGANCKPITQQWRIYSDLTASVQDFLSFIQGARYGNAYDQLMNGDIGFVTTLHTGGYFTANVQTYANNVSSISNTVQGMLPS